MTESSYIRHFDGFASAFAFLCIIPIPRSQHASLYSAARSMYLFPVIGAVIGGCTGLFAWGLFESMAEPLLVGVLASAAILVITGFHHTDGLADMADGLMTRGTHKRKIDAMKDKHTGISGTCSVLLCMIGLVVAVSMLDRGYAVFVGVILAEVAAKFSMVVMAIAGKPAVVSGITSGGTGAIFVKAMAEDRRKAVAACVIAVAIFLVLGGPAVGLAVLAVAICAPLVLSYVAYRNFGGVTGDVFGAANDITRVAALVTFVSI